MLQSISPLTFIKKKKYYYNNILKIIIKYYDDNDDDNDDKFPFPESVYFLLLEHQFFF